MLTDVLLQLKEYSQAMSKPYTGLFLRPDPRCLARESHAPDSGTAATLLLLEVVLHTAAALVGSTVTHTLDSSLNSGLNCHMCIGKEQEPAMINISKILHEQDIYQERPLPLLISIKPESSACQLGRSSGKRHLKTKDWKSSGKICKQEQRERSTKRTTVDKPVCKKDKNHNIGTTIC